MVQLLYFFEENAANKLPNTEIMTKVSFYVKVLFILKKV